MELDYNRLANAIATAIRNPSIVNIGDIRNPYKQFSFSIPNGETYDIFYTFNFWRLLSLSNSTGVQLRFGATGAMTDIAGAGIGQLMPEAVDRIQIINNSGGTITGIMGLAIGQIYDDRLTVSGTVSITGAVSIAPSTAIVTTAKATVVNGAAATQILAALSGREEAIITNKGAGEIYIGDSDVNATNIRGIPLQPNQTAILSTEAAIYAHNVSGANIDLAIAYTQD